MIKPQTPTVTVPKFGKGSTRFLYQIANFNLAVVVPNEDIPHGQMELFHEINTRKLYRLYGKGKQS